MRGCRPPQHSWDNTAPGPDPRPGTRARVPATAPRPHAQLCTRLSRRGRGHGMGGRLLLLLRPSWGAESQSRADGAGGEGAGRGRHTDTDPAGHEGPGPAAPKLPAEPPGPEPPALSPQASTDVPAKTPHLNLSQAPQTRDHPPAARRGLGPHSLRPAPPPAVWPSGGPSSGTPISTLHPRAAPNAEAHCRLGHRKWVCGSSWEPPRGAPIPAPSTPIRPGHGPITPGGTPAPAAPAFSLPNQRPQLGRLQGGGPGAWDGLVVSARDPARGHPGAHSSCRGRSHLPSPLQNFQPPYAPTVPTARSSWGLSQVPGSKPTRRRGTSSRTPIWGVQGGEEPQARPAAPRAPGCAETLRGAGGRDSCVAAGEEGLEAREVARPPATTWSPEPAAPATLPACVHALLPPPCPHRHSPAPRPGRQARPVPQTRRQWTAAGCPRARPSRTGRPPPASTLRATPSPGPAAHSTGRRPAPRGLSGPPAAEMLDHQGLSTATMAVTLTRGTDAPTYLWKLTRGVGGVKGARNLVVLKSRRRLGCVETIKMWSCPV